jgi:hypothetical protein
MPAHMAWPNPRGVSRGKLKSSRLGDSVPGLHYCDHEMVNVALGPHRQTPAMILS